MEVRLEGFLEVRRGDEAKGRGDGGIVFKSGAMVFGGRLLNERIRDAERIVARRYCQPGPFPFPVFLVSGTPFNVSCIEM